jgi:hypothetical protein
LRWQCADGRIEELILEGETGGQDRMALASEIEGRGLLVAEMLDMASAGEPPAQNWIACRETA